MLEGLLRCGSNADLVEFGWCAGERTDTTWKIERRKSGVSEEALNSWHVCETQDLEPGDGSYCKSPPPVAVTRTPSLYLVPIYRCGVPSVPHTPKVLINSDSYTFSQRFVGCTWFPVSH